MQSLIVVNLIVKRKKKKFFDPINGIKKSIRFCLEAHLCEIQRRLITGLMIK